jgi:hypothetical protein
MVPCHIIVGNMGKKNFSGPWENVCALWWYYLYLKIETKLYLTKLIPCPNPSGGSHDLAQVWVTLPQPLTQTLFQKIPKIGETYVGTVKVDLCSFLEIEMDNVTQNVLQKLYSL